MHYGKEASGYWVEMYGYETVPHRCRGGVQQTLFLRSRNAP